MGRSVVLFALAFVSCSAISLRKLSTSTPGKSGANRSVSVEIVIDDEDPAEIKTEALAALPKPTAPAVETYGDWTRGDSPNVSSVTTDSIAAEEVNLLAPGQAPAAPFPVHNSYAVTDQVLQEANLAVERDGENKSQKLAQLWSGSTSVDGEKLVSLFRNTYSYSPKMCFKLFQEDGTVFVNTGDIGQMWLRDSAVQLSLYLDLAAKSQPGSAIRQVMESAMARQRRFILDDPYGSAFYETHGEGDDAGPNKNECPPSPGCPSCHCDNCAPACGAYTYQKDWELDSLLFPILLHYTYWKQTGSTSHFDPELTSVLKTVLQTLRTEQHHNSKSKYFYKPVDGKITDGLGLVWSFALPSDDQAGASYNVPENIMASVVLEKASEMAAGPLKEPKLAEDLKALSTEIDTAVKKYGIVKDKNGNKMYAFSVNGKDEPKNAPIGILIHDPRDPEGVSHLPQAVSMDDANLPNLLWLPYLNVSHSYSHDPVYQNTRKFVLSKNDQNFFGDSSTKFQGLGSQHHSLGLRTGGRQCFGDCIWHLGLAMQGITADSQDEKTRVMNMMLKSDDGQDLMHEGFDARNPGDYNRDGFAFANSVFAQWVLKDWMTGTRDKEASSDWLSLDDRQP